MQFANMDLVFHFATILYCNVDWKVRDHNIVVRKEELEKLARKMKFMRVSNIVMGKTSERRAGLLKPRVCTINKHIHRKGKQGDIRIKIQIHLAKTKGGIKAECASIKLARKRLPPTLPSKHIPQLYN